MCVCVCVLCVCASVCMCAGKHKKYVSVFIELFSMQMSKTKDMQM